jgi:hypothetical protein
MTYDDDLYLDPRAAEYAARSAAIQREREIMNGVELSVLHHSDIKPNHIVLVSRLGMEAFLRQPVESPGLDNKFITNVSLQISNLSLWLTLGGDPATRQLLDTQRFQAHRLPPELEHLRPLYIETCNRETALWSSVSKTKLAFDAYMNSAGDGPTIAKTFFQNPDLFLQSTDFARIFRASPKNDLSLAQKTGVNITPVELQKPGEALAQGENVDRVLRALVAIGTCERPELGELRDRPGWKFLFEERGGVEERKYIGDPSKWQKDKRTEGDLKREKGDRGLLTKYGNIFARAESAEAQKEIREALCELVGGDRLAVEEAYRLFRITGLAAKFGILTLYDAPGDDIGRPDRSKAKVKIVQEGWPASSDVTTQYMNFRAYIIKQTRAGHFGGPYNTRGRYDKIMGDFFTNTVYEDKDNPDVDGKPTNKRTLWELMWGYADDPRNSNPDLRKGEKALKLGDVKWEELDENVMRKFYTTIFFAAGEGRLAEILMRESWQPKDLGQDSWEKTMLALNVLITPQLIYKEFRGRSFKDMKNGADSIKKETFWNGIYQGIVKNSTKANQDMLQKNGGLGDVGKTTQQSMEAIRDSVWNTRDLPPEVIDAFVDNYYSGRDFHGDPARSKSGVLNT